MSSPKDRAHEYLSYYFGLIARKAGVDWMTDNDAEVGIVVDAIDEMIRDAIQEHADRVQHPGGEL